MLDYRPNPVARALATGKSKTLGVRQLQHDALRPVVDALRDRARSSRSGLFRQHRQPAVSRPELCPRRIERLRAQGVGGILVIAPQTVAAHAVSQLPNDIPVVAVEAGPDEGVPVVTVDQFAGAALATRHLLELGHRTVWHIAGPTTGWRHSSASPAGVRRSSRREHRYRRFSWATGARSRGTSSVGDSRPIPRSPRCSRATTRWLWGFSEPFTRQVVTLPSAVSVVGFDDYPEAAYFIPPLTTIRQDFIEVGRRALNLMLEEIESGSRSRAARRCHRSWSCARARAASRSRPPARRRAGVLLGRR